MIIGLDQEVCSRQKFDYFRTLFDVYRSNMMLAFFFLHFKHFGENFFEKNVQFMFIFFFL